jgi:hypothetical protein
MLIRSTNHRTKKLINKAKPIKQPLTNPKQVNLPFLLLGMMECLVVVEAWFKVNERRNKTVDLGKKLVPDMSRIAVGDSNALHIHGELWFHLCLSTQKCSL